jgi:hypothetical protein
MQQNTRHLMVKVYTAVAEANIAKQNIIAI